MLLDNNHPMFPLLNRGIKYDLDRMKEAVSLCGHPEGSFLSIHTAGTNGKGSTCAYIESVLRAAGYKTGLFTSPFIRDFEEQFKINGDDIKDDLWLEALGDLEKIIARAELSFFEASTLLAFEVFRRSGVEYAVIETGMGGRLDATNIIVPEVSVITKIALDHREYLGDSLEKIAGEKLGIVKPGVPLVMADPEDEDLRELARRSCREKGSALSFVNLDEAEGLECGPAGLSFTWRGNDYELSLFGPHQVQNALLALNALGKIQDFDYGLLYRGLRGAFLPGRFQVLRAQGRDIVIDAGHNPDAAAVLSRALGAHFPGRPVLFVLGIMKDKDGSLMIKNLAEGASAFYLTQPKTERAARAEELKTLAEKFFGGRSLAAPSVEEALGLAIREAAPEDLICVTGSFYTAGEALKALGVK